MATTIHEASTGELEPLIPLLLLAEPSETALRWSLANLSDAVYRMDDEGRLVGAATMRWEGDPCEIVELAIAEREQGRGLGKALVAWLVAEAGRRGKGAMTVGTANASIDNIAFYQKCGFRMDEVRHDYFWYYRTPRFEHGIRVRDLLVFRYALVDGGTRSARRRRG
jgi:GNAT superfamily N-acetyltransferase